jgi:uncharacterized protein
MRFEWDEAKRIKNIQKHGFDFADVAEMFSRPILVAPDTTDDYGENRWQGLGWIRGRLTHVVFTEREPDVVRIISLRKATRRERKNFEETIYDGLEAD